MVQSLLNKVIEAIPWMARYFDRIGDSMPHMNQIHLPLGLPKCDIFYDERSIARPRLDYSCLFVTLLFNLG